MESITNEQLALQAQSGDKRALEQLWMQCKPYITGICKRYTREPMFPPEFDAEACEMLQIDQIKGVNLPLMYL